MRKRLVCRLLLCVFLVGLLAYRSPALAQGVVVPEYQTLFNSGQYDKAFEVIKKKLEQIYLQRVEDKRVPTGFITMRESAADKDLKKLFRERKARGFFIEDNQEISLLHLYAARCLGKKANNEAAFNHYIQCLRFKLVEGSDDVIYYEIAQLYKTARYYHAYVSALETAASLNPEQYSHSLELGRYLSTTADRKRAIYHLDRYVKSAEEQYQPEIDIMLASLNEDIGRYLETERYYRKYLQKKPNDGFIHFALGFTAVTRTGNAELAESSFNRALELLPEKELFRRSRAYEYLGDIAWKNLSFVKAVQLYGQTMQFQETIAGEITKKKAEIDRIAKEINALKSALLVEQNFDKYEQYENLKDEKGKRELELARVESEYVKLNAGRVRWFIADCHERMEQYGDAIRYYRDCLTHDFQSTQARDKITKIQLKIKRGY